MIIVKKSVLLIVIFAVISTVLISDESRRIALNNTKKRTALVIGNGGYSWGSLKNPVNDARAVREALKDLGFDVIYLENADFRKMEEAVRDLDKKLRAGGVGLFYFAGHGLQMEGINYLVPIGTEIQNEADIRYRTVSVDWVADTMGYAGNRLNILILDACRSNPIGRSLSRNVSSGLTNMNAAKGMFIAYATAPGKTASDGENLKNGLFTHYFLKAIKQDGSTLDDVFKYVRENVDRDSNEKQLPYTTSAVINPFYFKPSQAPVRPEIPVSSSSNSKLNKPSTFSRDYEKLSPNQLYQTAYADYLRGNYNLAIEGFKEYIQRYPDSELAAAVQYWLGESCYAKGNYKEAITEFDKVIVNFPSDEKVKSAGLKKGFAFFELNQIAQGVIIMQQIIREFPNSKQAKRAQEKLKSLDEPQKIESEKGKERAGWDSWQGKFKAAIDEAKKLDGDKNLFAKSKKSAWEKILSDFSVDNPYTADDENLRNYVKDRISYWERESLKPSPYEIQSKAVKGYEIGKVYENKYYETHDPWYAEVAIENFLIYYQNQPDGPLSFFSLYSRAELFFRLGQKDNAIKELDIIVARKDFINKYSNEIKNMEKLFYGKL